MPVSISKAQSQALNSGFFSTLGSDKDSFAGLDITNTAQALAEVAADFVIDATDNLNKDDKVSSGHLSDSIVSLPLRMMGQTIVADVKAADYYDFVNKGVRGTQGGGNSPYSFKNNKVGKKMMQEIRKWVIREGIRARNVKRGITHRETAGRKITDTSTKTAYAIAASVKRKGLKRTGFWDDALVSLKQEISDKIGAAFKVDVVNSVVPPKK